MISRSMAERTVEAGTTRDLILDAAERSFAEHGFAGVAMREIAAQAGLKNQASLYHHFPNKRALYEAVLRRGLEPIFALIAESGRAAVEHGHPNWRVVQGVNDRLLDYLTEHPHLPRLIQRAGLDDSAYLKDAIKEFLVPLYASGVSVLAGTGGPWQASDLPYVALGLYHLIFGYFANASLVQVLLQADPRGPEAAARHRRFVKAAVAQLLALPKESKGEDRTHEAHST